MRKCQLITLLLIVFTNYYSLGQYTNRGTDFWVGYQSTGALAVTMKVYISTLSTGDSVTITIKQGSAGEWKKTYWVSPNTTQISDDIPATGISDARLNTEGLHQNKGIHITSRGVPVSAYVHMFGMASSGSSMLLPSSAFGYEHFILNITQNYGAGQYSVFHVIASQDSTWVEINPTQQTQGGWTFNGGTQSNGSYLVKLNKGDVYQVLASSITTDLTGSTVLSVPNGQGITKPIAVFGGSTRTVLNCSLLAVSGGDLMIGQVFPTQLWSTKFATAPFSGSPSANILVPTIYRVIVKDPTTVVRKNGTILNGIVNSRFYQYESATADLITSDKPIMVAQYMTGSCPVGSYDGDPEMIYISPLSEAVAKTVFLRNTVSVIKENYVTLIIPTAGIGSLKIDGISFANATTTYSYPHPNLYGYTVAVKRWTAAQAQCIVESNYAFTGVTYGLGSVESYGYNIGAQFDSANLQQVPYNTITAKIFLDANSNGSQDVGEPIFQYSKVRTIKPGIDTLLNYDPSGNITTYTDTGNYISNPVPFSPYYISVPGFHTSSFSSYHLHDSTSFAMQPIASVRDLFVGLVPLTTARPGFPDNYSILYGNKGTDTADAVISLAKSNKLSYVSSTRPPTSVTSDTIKWNITSLKPMDTASIIVRFVLASSPGININDTLKFIASISSNKVDSMPTDNTFDFRHRVRGAYDPNDKLESHDGEILKSVAASGGGLSYTIRFQNTGTDTAFNIIVRDTLDPKLDWSSLKMVSASNAYSLVVNDGIAIWSFNGIKLVDSNRNEPLSHGFINFSINARSSVTNGDLIVNRASIYFDHNVPVATNDELTNIINDVLPVTLLSFTGSHNDNVNLLKWRVSQQVNFSHFELDRSENGKDFIAIAKVNHSGEEYSFPDLSYRKAINYYRLKLVDKDGSFEYSPLRRINNLGNIDVSLYPNPAENSLHLKVLSNKVETLQLEIIAIDGRIIQKQNAYLNMGQNSFALDISSLANGSFILRVSNNQQETTILKFSKQ